MPVAHHRLDLHLVAPDPDAHPIEQARAALEALRREEVIDAFGRPAANADGWIEGGFRRVRLDDPGHVALVANQTGGFRVGCPTCGANVVPAFVRALSSYRAGGPRALACPTCHAGVALESLAFAPPAAFARVGLVTEDVGSVRLTAEASAWVDVRLRDWKRILRRP